MTEALDRYTASVAALDQLPGAIRTARQRAADDHERARRSAANGRASAAPATRELRAHVQRLIDDGRNMLDVIGEADQLPRQVRAEGRPTEVSQAESDLRALASAVTAVQKHRAAARERRLAEGKERERSAGAEKDARQQAALGRQREAEQRRRAAVARRARIVAAAVAAVAVVVALVLALASPIAMVLTLVVGTAAAWMTYRQLDRDPT
jgi:hypothetical protein